MSCSKYGSIQPSNCVEEQDNICILEQVLSVVSFNVHSSTLAPAAAEQHSPQSPLGGAIHNKRGQGKGRKALTMDVQYKHITA